MPDKNELWRSYIDAFEQTARSMVALGERLEPADWERPTECPGWSVQDQFSHILDLERWLAGEADPDAPRPTTDDMDTAVVALRSRAGKDIVAELRGVIDRRVGQLRSGEIDLAEPFDAPFGRTLPYGDLLLSRSFDVWTHEQDVRRATGRPGNLDAPAAECAATVLGGGMPFVVGKRAKAAPGQSVVFHAGHRKWCVLVGDDGRAQATGAVERPTVTLRMDWETFVRLATGRAGPDQVAVEVAGDEDLAGRVLGAMSVTP